VQKDHLQNVLSEVVVLEVQEVYFVSLKLLKALVWLMREVIHSFHAQKELIVLILLLHLQMEVAVIKI
jgi:hypothetical protein